MAFPSLPKFPSPPIIPGLPRLPFTEKVEEDESEEDEEDEEDEILHEELDNEEQDLIKQIRANYTLKEQVVNYAKGREKIDPEKSLEHWKESMRDLGVEPGIEVSKNFHEGLSRSLGRI
jgi:hypothetical protein